jgi:ribonuclease T1
VKPREALRQALAALVAAVLCFAAWGFSTLPPEAQETIARIEAGGPFPYKQDGRVFHNREGLLPQAQRGYYREYTVRTPGARDRGARRIVAGREGEYSYTEDHYRSFRRIRK